MRRPARERRLTDHFPILMEDFPMVSILDDKDWNKPHYNVRKVGKVWLIERIDQPCRIGEVTKRSEAICIASLLAGFRGLVTLNGKEV